MKHIFFLFLFFLLSNFFSKAQNIIIDSLKLELDKTHHDTAKMRILNSMVIAEKNIEIGINYDNKLEALAKSNFNSKYSFVIQNTCKKYLAHIIHRKGVRSYNHGDYIKALEYYNQCLIIYEELNDNISISSILHKMGVVYKDKGDFTKSLLFHNKSLEIREKSGDKLSISKSLTSIGNVYTELGNIPKALEYYHKSLKLKEGIGDKSSIATTLHNIGINYANQGDIAKALEYYTRGLKIREELGEKKGISVSLNSIGIIYAGQEDMPKALEYFNKSLNIKKEINDKSGIAYSLNNLGIIFKNKDDFTNALLYYNKCLKLFEELDDKVGITMVLSNIGNIYLEQSDFYKALDFLNRSLKIKEELNLKGDISGDLNSIGIIYLKTNQIIKALDCAKKAYKFAQETGFVEHIRDAAELLEKIYSTQGNYKLSRMYFGEYIIMRDSITKQENQKLIQEKYYQYQYEKKAAIDSIAHNKAMQISNLEIEKQKSESKKQKIIIGFTVFGLLLIMVFSVFIYRSLHITKRQKFVIEEQKQMVDKANEDLNQQNEEIKAQRDEIESQRNTVTKQKEHIEEIHKEITDSINYAKRIQQAILPNLELILTNGIQYSVIGKQYTDYRLPIAEYFVLFKPKDIVSGDFYWATKINEWLIVTVADCTGHGVPGAFMSMLGVSFLNEIVRKKEIKKASDVLNQLRLSVIDALRQTSESGTQKDGMDIALCVINTDTLEMQFAGANNPCYVVSSQQSAVGSHKMDSQLPTAAANCQLIELKGDKMPVAIYDKMNSFTNQYYNLQKGDIIYLMSDGYEDQFGGEKNKKFMSKNLKNLLIANCQQPTANQKQILETIITEWIGTGEQIDDITVLGIRI